ncbi:MAG: hypothetical protein EAX95_08550 [Candidatus Thorarchaeota archaeon]|nr:hypothetical protein [Candidatus Thorarchaeota archaeon]
MPETRVGIFLCHCGSNIAGVVNIDRVMEAIRGLPNVEHVEDYKYLCSRPGQQMVKDRIKQHRLNRVVIASCSPRMHEPTFRPCVRPD